MGRLYAYWQCISWQEAKAAIGEHCDCTPLLAGDAEDQPLPLHQINHLKIHMDELLVLESFSLKPDPLPFNLNYRHNKALDLLKGHLIPAFRPPAMA